MVQTRRTRRPSKATGKRLGVVVLGLVVSSSCQHGKVQALNLDDSNGNESGGLRRSLSTSANKLREGLGMLFAKPDPALTADDSTGTTTLSTHHHTSVVIPDSFMRIVGGSAVKVNEFASYGRSVGKMLCGATLVHEDILLTAAHCSGAFINAFIGGSKLDGTGSEFIAVTKEYPHPSFSMAEVKNDIMLVKLSKPSKAPLQKLNFDSTVPDISEKKPLTVIGFGATTENGRLADLLMKVDINMIDYQYCYKFWSGKNYKIDKIKQMCAGVLDGGKDSCQGDSGGPLYTNLGTASAKNYVQVGIVSFGFGCALENSPPVYTNIAAYKDFIQDGICKYSSEPPLYCKTLASAKKGDVKPGNSTSTEGATHTKKKKKRCPCSKTATACRKKYKC